MSARLSTSHHAGRHRRECSRGTYQVQHDVKSDRLELFDLEKQKGRHLADFLRYPQCRAQKLSPVALAVDSTGCRNSGGDLKDLSPKAEKKSGSIWSNSLKKKSDYC